MTHFRIPFFLKWVSSHFVYDHKTLSNPSELMLFVLRNVRFYGRGRVVGSEKIETLCGSLVDNEQKTGNFSAAKIKEAEAALLDYLHSTRSLRFVDAEPMCKNSLHFIGKLLEKVDVEGSIGRSMARFLRYHPINEFEPFFESLGLKPCEYANLLPRDLMFLSDDASLLENCNVLCGYGIPRNKLGKVYVGASEVFRLKHGVLELKLRAYEELGLSQSFVAKLAICSPVILLGDVNKEFVEVLETLRKGGIEDNWIEQRLLEGGCYNWSRLCSLLTIFRMIGCNEEQLGSALKEHPDILFDGSGARTFTLISLLCKFGSPVCKIPSIFFQFPSMEVSEFVLNLRRCIVFLNEIEMELHDIGKLVSEHSLVLGSCKMKKTSSLLNMLNCGKKRLCKVIMENPNNMRNWVMGFKVKRLPDEDQALQMIKIRFLKDIGLEENSEKMLKKLKAFKGKPTELQERFDCLLKAGLDKKNASEIIIQYPQILNQTKHVIQKKIDFLVNDLGYPISSLHVFPAYLCYTIQRVKLRLEMYNWLKERGIADPTLSFHTIIGSSDIQFVKHHVNSHVKGPQMWQTLKKKIYTESQLT